jgi:hypothetical protein
MSGDGGDGSGRRGARLLTAAAAGSSIAALAVAGAWALPKEAFDAASARRQADRRVEAPQKLQKPFGFQWTSSKPSGMASALTPLVLTGVSGEALAPPPVEGAAAAFTAPLTAHRTAHGVFMASGPVSLGDQTIVTAPGEPAPGLKAAHPHASANGQAAADPHIPVADYALVFAQQPDSSASANLEQATLRAGWRAVVETLILTSEPKPEAVHNL